VKVAGGGPSVHACACSLGEKFVGGYSIFFFLYFRSAPLVRFISPRFGVCQMCWPRPDFGLGGRWPQVQHMGRDRLRPVWQGARGPTPALESWKRDNPWPRAEHEAAPRPKCAPPSPKNRTLPWRVPPFLDACPAGMVPIPPQFGADTPRTDTRTCHVSVCTGDVSHKFWCIM